MTAEPVPVLSATLESIGPREAKRYLSRNKHNRSVRQRVVSAYTRDMLAGRWFPGVDTITFDTDGILLNGQHTLLAVVAASEQAGKPVYISAIVVRNQHPQAQNVMDAGAGRKMSDQLGLAGEPNRNVLAAAARISFLYDKYKIDYSTAAAKETPTHLELFDWIAENPDIRESMRLTMHIANGELRFVHSVATALHYQFWKQTDVDTASEFFTKLASGSDLTEGTPLFALRRFLINNLGAPRKVDSLTIMAVTIKAWNKWRNSEAARVMTWDRGRESFPLIGGSE